MSDPKLGIIVQARLGSTRLPGKVCKPFYHSRSILDIIINKLKELPFPLILATSANSADDRIAEFAQENAVHCYRGSEHNVLQRFTEAALQFKLDYAVRICADNPFLSIYWINQLLDQASGRKYAFDYLSFSYRSVPVILSHFGIFAELVKVKALQKIRELTDDPFYLEHVTNYLYKHPESFEIALQELDPDIFVDPGIRLTVDTEADFKLATALYRELMEQYGHVEVDAINDYLSRHPALIDQMKEQIRLNEKR